MKGDGYGLFQVAGVLLTFAVTGCETDSEYVPVEKPSVPAPVASSIRVPVEFLATTFAPLQRWLDEPFEVEYRNMTPELIFEQPPIADIRYETSELPQDAPLFDLKSSSMSRREILYKISEFWNLEMSLAGETGKPSYVLVSGR
jgi:hypothetical protein